MAENPLKKYFRQPKIYVDLPSRGLYCRPGTLLGDPVQLPVYGMTGMDEVISKTPDALLTGDATAAIIESCVPSINDAKSLSILDLQFLMIAIRIATYGNTLEFKHTCSKCQEISDFEIDLGNLITHYSKLTFEDSVPTKDLTIKLKPLTIAQSLKHGLDMFKVQRSLFQLTSSDNPEESAEEIRKFLEEIAKIQNTILADQIDTIEIEDGSVDEKAFLNEWLENADKQIFDKIRDTLERNKKTWDVPEIPVKCDKCNHEEHTILNLEPSSFFVKA